MKICIPIALLLAVASPALAQDMMSDQILAVHNNERAAVGVAPLSWSDTLAQDAQTWADHLAAEGKFEHSSTGDGENLWMGSTGYYSYGDMAQAWADEKALFKYGAFPDLSTDGNWASVGHYTQMIWSTTTQVGCAKSTGSSMDILVCRYRTPGNYWGQKPY
ncbi:SCP-like extracellular family protein [Asticcacaulis biprosthecium C19]|uniref:SCP-like extracellular family protein n=1 Tax=Asticcacaulis biprosthecium C19 TaxID=715226 RepID=F4QPE4_9CAUL|nr:CAP domain-containing protein [Asticcacaulis biprosthecium]EGF91202.1 SCP-like extracellular family protein [Asticcacaulis biprosthecium C19]